MKRRADAVAHLADPQRRQQGSVAGEHADLTVGRGQHDFIDFDVDDLPLARDDGEVDLGRKCVGHPVPYAASFFICSARSSTCSIVPMSRKACSGMSSCFPSTISLKPRIVSAILTYCPLMPVNCSATWNGCERKR